MWDGLVKGGAEQERSGRRWREAAPSAAFHAERLSGTEPERRKFNWSGRRQCAGREVTLQRLRFSRQKFVTVGF